MHSGMDVVLGPNHRHLAALLLSGLPDEGKFILCTRPPCVTHRETGGRDVRNACMERGVVRGIDWSSQLELKYEDT